MSAKETTDIAGSTRAIASFASGLTESVIAWPFDKYKNLAMLNLAHLNNHHFLKKLVITLCGEHYQSHTWLHNVRTSYRGFPAYAVHKTVNRGLKFGFQDPLMTMMMHTHSYEVASLYFGKENAKIAASTLSGISVGLLEVGANPIDLIKAICQKQNITIRQAIAQVSQKDLSELYAGAKETAFRNGLGSGSLFFGKFLAYKILGVENHNKASFLESFFSSMVGASVCITASHLPDVAKIRAQMDPKTKMSMTKRIYTIAKNEGVSALSKGYTTKLLGSGVKLGVVMTGCDMLTQYIHKIMSPTPLEQHGLFKENPRKTFEAMEEKVISVIKPEK